MSFNPALLQTEWERQKGNYCQLSRCKHYVAAMLKKEELPERCRIYCQGIDFLEACPDALASEIKPRIKTN